MDRVTAGEQFGTMPKKNRFQKRGRGPSPRTYITNEEAEEEILPQEKHQFGEKPKDILKRYTLEQDPIPKERLIDNWRRRFGMWLLTQGLKIWLAGRKNTPVEVCTFDKDLYLSECRKLWNERLAKKVRLSPKVIYLLKIHPEGEDDG